MRGLVSPMPLRRSYRTKFRVFSGEPILSIFITAHGDAETRTRALRAGAVAFLDKPFSDEALLRAVEAALPSARGDGSGAQR